jgi:DNA-binding CsgD family transcriptional regulator
MTAPEPVLEAEVVSRPVFEDAPPPGPRDYLALIEAAYDLTTDNRSWLLQVLRTASPMLDSGHGVSGWFWDLAQEGKIKIDHPTYVGCSRELFEAHRTSGQKFTAAQAQRFHLLGRPCKLMEPRALREYGKVNTTYRDHMTPDGFVNVTCADLTRVGCMIFAPRAGPSRLAPAVQRTFDQVARHIVAAMRLRQALGSARSIGVDGADAVFDQQGRLVHAEPDASGQRQRASLLDGVRRLLDSRQVRRSQPEHAVALWRALVIGQWSLVDHQDSDGKRFLLAQRNSLVVPEPTALTEAERSAAGLYALMGSVKLVAYELGLAQSTISEQLMAASRKLGCRDRFELARIFGVRSGALR